MKKFLAFLLTAVLLATVSVGVVFAAPSPEAEGVISGMTSVDSNGKYGCIRLEKIDDKLSKDFQETIEDLKDKVSDDTLKAVDHYDVIVIGDPKFEVTVSLEVLGITESSKVFILVQTGDKVKVIEPKFENGKLVFDIEKGYDRLAIVTDGKTAATVEKENNVLSPQTADITPYVVVVMAVMALGLTLVSKKVKA